MQLLPMFEDNQQIALRIVVLTSVLANNISCPNLVCGYFYSSIRWVIFQRALAL